MPPKKGTKGQVAFKGKAMGNVPKVKNEMTTKKKGKGKAVARGDEPPPEVREPKLSMLPCGCDLFCYSDFVF